jgi:hypothetical protein
MVSATCLTVICISEETHLSGQDQDGVLPLSIEGVDDGTANLSGASGDSDDGHVDMFGLNQNLWRCDTGVVRDLLARSTKRGPLVSSLIDRRSVDERMLFNSFLGT